MKWVGLGLGLAGAALACGSVLTSVGMALPLSPWWIVGRGLALEVINHESKYEKVFRMCGLENKAKQIPLVIRKQGNNLIVHMPNGICQKDFERHQQEIEQAINKKIEFSFNKELVIKLLDNNLKYDYSFELLSESKQLNILIGQSREGKFFLDITDCPHVIIAGETGSGKSSLLDTIVLSLLLGEYNVDLHLIDFQAVGLGKYEDCRKVKSYGETPKDFEMLMQDLSAENERRLKLFRSVKNKVYIDSLEAWNKRFTPMPYKVVIIDEFSRLAESNYEYLMEKFRTMISMSRKVGIHFICAMQRPDVKIIAGSIKANMPVRIAGKTVSQVDSEVILDMPGAEEIKNPGRFLVKYCGELKEFQLNYIESSKIRKLLKKQDAFRTAEEIKQERIEKMKELRAKCINPYVEK